MMIANVLPNVEDTDYPNGVTMDKGAWMKGVSLVCVAALALTGCGGSNKANTGAGADSIPKPNVQCDVPADNVSNDKVDTSKVSGEITFMTTGLKNDFSPFFTKQIADFEKANPGTKINWTDQGGSEDYDNIISTQAQGCKMADVVNVPSSALLALSKKNMLLDLDVKMPGVGDKFIPAIWDSVKLGANDHHTAMPWYWGPYITTYNKEVFKKAGLDPNTPPKTMDERFAMAKKIAEAKTGDFAIYGNASWYLTAELEGMGAKLINDDATEFIFAQEPQVKKWVDNMAELYKLGAIPKDSLTSEPDPGKFYNNGNLAFGTPNASFLNSVRKNNPTVYSQTGVGTFPLSDGAKPAFEGQFIGVSVTTKNLPLAAKFAEYVTSAEQELAWTRDGGATIFPIATEALNKLSANPPETASDPVAKEAYKIAAQEAKEAEAQKAVFYLTGKVQNVFIQTINKAVRGDMGSQEALDSAQAEMNKLLKQLNR